MLVIRKNTNKKNSNNKEYRQVLDEELLYNNSFDYSYVINYPHFKETKALNNKFR